MSRLPPLIRTIQLVLLSSCSVGAGSMPLPHQTIPVPSSSRQLLLVRTSNWSSIQGSLQRFERTGPDAGWTSVGAPEPIVVGKTGLAWGRGLHGETAQGEGPIKHEGDGRSPAGAFTLSQVFGYAPADSIPGLKMPYVQASSDLKCPDDPAAAAYNTLTHAPAAGPLPWNSAEDMRRRDEAYRIGVFVDHNVGAQRKPGGGSCIFLHVWSGPDRPTVGCTAMPLERMEAIAVWLDQREHPILVQLPDETYQRLRKDWGLP